MIATWDDLAALRAAGKRPGLPVVVTLRRADAWRVFTEPFCVIVHEPGKPFPVELLDGLEVLLRMPCPQAAAIARLIRAKGVAVRRCESWCDCAAELTQFPSPSCRDWTPLTEVTDAAAA